MSTATMTKEAKLTTEQVAHRLHDFLLKNDTKSAQEQLYAKDAISIEPHSMNGYEKETHGLDGIIAKRKKFEQETEKIDSVTVSEPVVSGNSFALRLEMDIAMKGQEPKPMSELAVYTVKDGKIVSEQFFI